MMHKLLYLFMVLSISGVAEAQSVIRINLLGYKSSAIKVAVWCNKDTSGIKLFTVKESLTGRVVFSGSAGRRFGAYGPFKQSQRLDFTKLNKPGRYYLESGGSRSPVFEIGNEIYNGKADFCLRYMRQQRSGFNPFLKDSCHTYDGYTLYGPMPDSTYINVIGGWHDASDYLQYVSTSANATYHLLMAYRDFPGAFSDAHLANGLQGANQVPDVLDEANWGLQWLLKMNPRRDLFFNQLGDDRDHISMRLPALDSQYGKGYERPVYFLSGKPQQRGKFLNNTTGTSSTAAKYASVYALAHRFFEMDDVFKRISPQGGYYARAFEALDYANKKPGVTQTASVRAPYIYAEENWQDDMELAHIAIHEMVNHSPKGADNGYYMMLALSNAAKEKHTPWLGADTAAHYQWYPFINIGHYELLRNLKTRKHGPEAGYNRDFQKKFWSQTDTVMKYYREGIEKVWAKARNNAFYRGVPFIWCSNNLTTAFAMQCNWYRTLSGSKQFEALEQANIDWLFGCNPWGTSFVYGMPGDGDNPQDPHSAFTHLKNYPIDGGLVDGPVYGSIYNSLIGIKLYQPDEYAEFQSNLAVYHDDYGDYSTNEPTMDGTASLIYLLASQAVESPKDKNKRPGFLYDKGAIIRGKKDSANIALVFTAHEFGEGGSLIAEQLKRNQTPGSFFFTGDFYRNPQNHNLIQQLKQEGHYLGPHSDKHLQYASWQKRDSLLVTRDSFVADLRSNLKSMKALGIPPGSFLLPPYEWFNDSIAVWSRESGMQLINFTPGTNSTADYTWPELRNYRGSDEIYLSIFEREKVAGLNGQLLLIHAGTDPRRTDKFYTRLEKLIQELKKRGYRFVRMDRLLE